MTGLRARLTALLIAAVAATTLSACSGSDGGGGGMDLEIDIDRSYNEICVNTRTDRRVADRECDYRRVGVQWWYLQPGSYVAIGQRVTGGTDRKPAYVRRAPIVSPTKTAARTTAATTTAAKTTAAKSSAKKSTTRKTTTRKTTRTRSTR
ncbi:hypothetical protein SEA_VANLEE_67 [Gordonia phage VanLee]|uniref:Lipoprotein n=1 Tax=Gordonia phage VanLee TaxID=2845816 RepID=A0A8F2D9F0_9CAUD|nr:hypothetical protein QEH49_gp067 [Gordonia phage VanLee]QWS68184.1 hypothetical protein SEA_VANLEE_67 [Gordonia phage VanLee]